MVIGIDASRANRQHKSGTEWYSYYLIRALAKIDSENQYLLYSDKPLIGGLLNLTDDINTTDDSHVRMDKHGFQKLYSPHDNFNAKILKWPFNNFWTQGRLSLEMIFNAPDILFIQAHTLPFIHPEKSIITIHDIGFEREDCLYSKEQIGPQNINLRKFIDFIVLLFTRGKYGANTKDYLRWSTRFALKNAAKVITISDFSKNEIISVYGVSETHICSIHNGYNSQLYKKIDDQEKINKVLDKYGIERPYIFYVGRLEKKKNTPALIEAFALMRKENKNIRHKLILAGDASFGYDDVKYAIKEFEVDDEVLMTGWVDEEDLPYIYAGAEAFIFPSLYEGFGIPLAQAMSMGTPIAASRAASIPEVVGEAALLFDPASINEMADSMKKIILDEDLRKKLKELGSERAKNFNWEKCAEETLAEIKKM